MPERCLGMTIVIPIVEACPKLIGIRHVGVDGRVVTLGSCYPSGEGSAAASEIANNAFQRRSWNEFRRALGELLVINRPSNGPGYLQEGMRRPAKAPPTVCGLAFATRTGWINRIAGLAAAV